MVQGSGRQQFQAGRASSTNLIVGAQLERIVKRFLLLLRLIRHLELGHGIERWRATVHPLLTSGTVLFLLDGLVFLKESPVYVCHLIVWVDYLIADLAVVRQCIITVLLLERFNFPFVQYLLCFQGLLVLGHNNLAPLVNFLPLFDE